MGYYTKYTMLLSARLQFDEQLVNIKRRVAVNICLGRYPVVARRCLASYTLDLGDVNGRFRSRSPWARSAPEY